jgi:hypothetical protein
MIFNSWEEAEEKFYKTNDCLSDDSDKEGARIEAWVEGCGHHVTETMGEIPNEAINVLTEKI